MSDETFLQGINPKFREWYGAQLEGARAEIRAHWETLFNDPHIAHDQSVGQHARQSKLLAWCADRLGYDFT